jgi:hypothetical protein
LHLSLPGTENSPCAGRPIVGRRQVKTGLKQSNNIQRNTNRVYSNLFAIARPPPCCERLLFRALPMNHSLYSADRQTHRRIIGSAFLKILIITMFGVAAFSKLKTQPAQPSVAVLRAGIPLATTDGGYIVVR